MVLAAGAAGAGSSAGAGAGAATSLFTTTGIGVGGVFVAVALVLLLAYLNILEASDQNIEQHRTFAIAATVPLFLTFSAILVFEVMTLL